MRNILWVLMVAVGCGGGGTSTGGGDHRLDAGLDVPRLDQAGPGETALPDAVEPEATVTDVPEPDPGVTPDHGVTPDLGELDPGAKDPSTTETGQPDHGPVHECEADKDCESKLQGLGPCQAAVCEQATHTCMARARTDGTECDDQNACTKEDRCSNGVCKGKPVTCDDGNICTTDDCDPDQGCKHTNNTVACDDGNSCTEGDVCKDGACVPGENKCQCKDDKDCIPYDDQDLCTGVMKCVANKCVLDPTTVVQCPPAEEGGCKVSTCNPSTGKCELSPVADGKPCDDKNACTQGERCTAGECGGGEAVSCDDGNPCTTDTCHEVAGCLHSFNTDPCDDGDECTTGDKCANGVCQPGELTCPTTCKPAMALFCDVSHKWDNGGEGSTNVASGYSCNEGEDYSGPEFTYSFVAPYDGTFTVTLSDEAADTDVLVLEGEGGCDPQRCVAWGKDSVTFKGSSYKTYYIVVDGHEGASGAYSINVTCVPEVELYCDDGVDNDKDGATDCDDKADCLGKPACPLPGCEPGWSLGCGESDTWATYWFGATKQVDGYNCNTNSYTGPEYAYEFKSDKKQKVLVKLTNESGLTDLLVLKGKCAADQCIDSGAVQSTFVAEPGETYYFVVDGRDGSEGKYKISVTCTKLTETVCDDNKDNEGDGLVDCDDPDCLGTEACPTCQWDYVLLCGDTDSWGTGKDGTTNVVEKYGCSEGPYAGPEYTYFFQTDSDQTVTVSLADETADLDILVLEAGEKLVCDPGRCIAWGTDEVTFNAKAGVRYFIVVEAWTGGPDPVLTGDYTISVNCM